MKYVIFPWSPVVTAINRKRLRLALLSSENHWLKKKSLSLGFSSVHQNLTFSPKLGRRRFPIKITFAMTVSFKGRRLNVLEYDYHTLIFSWTAVCSIFQISLLDKGADASIVTHEQRKKHYRKIISNI
jgi:hypothetical protein